MTPPQSDSRTKLPGILGHQTNQSNEVGDRAEITKDLINSKRIIGLLLILKPYDQLTNFDNILDFDVEKFMKDNENALWRKVRGIIQSELKPKPEGKEPPEVVDLE